MGTVPVQLQLPEAPPRTYLRWMAYWRDIESKLARNRLLERFVSSESATFLSDDVARFISDGLVAEIERQSSEALLNDEQTVSPTVRGDADLLRRSVEYVIRRARWLQIPEMAEVTGLEPLDDDLADLRAKVVAVVQLQLGETLRDPRRIGRPIDSGPDRRSQEVHDQDQ